MQRPVGVDVMVRAIVSSDLAETTLNLVGARLVIQLHLDGVIGPSHGQKVVLAIVHSFVQVQQLGTGAEIDLHRQFPLLQLNAQKVRHIFHYIIRRGSGINQRASVVGRVKSHGQVRVAAGGKAAMPRPALSVEGSCQKFAIGSKLVRVVGWANAGVASGGFGLARAVVETGIRIARLVIVDG